MTEVAKLFMSGRSQAVRLPKSLRFSGTEVIAKRFGVAKSGSQRNLLALEKFLAPLEVLPFDEAAMRHYGPLRSELERSGQPIGALDTLIAAHALALGATLVTDNVREFERVPGLTVENWC